MKRIAWGPLLLILGLFMNSCDRTTTQEAEEKIVKTVVEKPVTGQMIDARDGEQYATIQIGNQTWLSENIRYKVEGSEENSFSETKKTGRFYTWAQAQEACPKGWHLPGDAEWQDMEEHLGMTREEVNDKDVYRGAIANKLKSKTGFNALLVGYRNFLTGAFEGQGQGVAFWTSSLVESDRLKAMARDINEEKMGVGRFEMHREHGFVCRCVKN